MEKPSDKNFEPKTAPRSGPPHNVAASIKEIERLKALEQEEGRSEERAQEINRQIAKLVIGLRRLGYSA